MDNKIKNILQYLSLLLFKVIILFVYYYIVSTLTISDSREVRTTVPGELEVEYGPGKNQKLDIYGIDLPSGNFLRNI